MRITILAVGRLKAGPERDLFDLYMGRLRWPVTVKEVEERRKLPAAARKRREAELLAAARPAGNRLVALDEAGTQLSSAALAKRLGAWQDGGAPGVAFAIGGADGLDDALCESADLVMSFGAATWPHLLVRAMLAEQLYRAQQILAGHPYHRA